MSPISRQLSHILPPATEPIPSTPITIQLLSDIHLEVASQYATYTFPPTDPYLLLAGDIGNLAHRAPYLTFLTSLLPNYTRTFLLLGNHEFYGFTYEEGITAAENLVKEDVLEGKVTLLSKTRWDDVGSELTILGCTLWSDVPRKSRDIVAYRLADFLHIKGWSVERHNATHRQETAWLAAQLRQIIREDKAIRRASQTTDPKAPQPEKERKRKVLVVTHHAPLMKGTAPRQESQPWAPAFATALITPRRPWSRVAIWAFGHTHCSTSLTAGSTRVVANQRGYVFEGNWEPPDENFNPGFVIEM